MPWSDRHILISITILISPCNNLIHKISSVPWRDIPFCQVQFSKRFPSLKKKQTFRQAVFHHHPTGASRTWKGIGQGLIDEFRIIKVPDLVASRDPFFPIGAPGIPVFQREVWLDSLSRPNRPWKNRFERLIFPTTYVIRKSLSRLAIGQVSRPLKPAQNTLSEGSWSTRVYDRWWFFPTHLKNMIVKLDDFPR